MLEGYQEYDSIIGNGYSYLDLPFNLTGSSKIVCEFTWNGVTVKASQCRLFGNNKQTDVQTGMCYGYGNRSLAISYASVSFILSNICTKGKHSICLDGNHLYYDFTHIKTWNYVEYQHTTSLRLMAYYDDTYRNVDTIKFHAFKIAADSTSDWLFDLVPAKRLSDGVGGWYNKVDDTFYKSTDTRYDFTLGYPVVHMDKVVKIEQLSNPNYHYLPEEYTEVEYLESDGDGPFIDSGIIFTQEHGVRMRMQLSEKYHSRYMSGDLVILGSVSPNLGFGIYHDKFITDWKRSTGQTDPSWNFPVDYNIHEIKVNFNNDSKAYIDDTIEVMLNKWELSTEYKNAYIFAGNFRDNKPYGKTPLHIYDVVITHMQYIIQHLIPCYRNSDNKPGMYDLVSKQFFTNAGDGEFTVGPALVCKEVKRIADNTGKVLWNRLPKEYQEVEYLQSNGDELIDTGIFIGPNHKMEVTFFETEYNNTKSPQILTLSSNYSYSNLFRLDFNGHIRFFINNTQVYNPTYFREKILEKGNVTIIDKDYITTKTKAGEKWVKQHDEITQVFEETLKVFGPSSQSYRGTMCIERFVAWENNQLIQHLIPCYRKSDHKPGMFDLVSRQFLTNAGEGEFILGPEV